MEFINATRMVAGYTLATDKTGRELLVIAVKGTFRLPLPGEPVRLYEEQVPLVMADTFTGEPGLSAPCYEVDFAPRKARCDVLLLGSAYAPDGRPATGVTVGIRVGEMRKSFRVTGERHWDTRLTGIAASSPSAFVVRKISYDTAFGGVDMHHEDPTQHAAFMSNPVGCGFHKHLRPHWLEGQPLPTTEELGHPVVRPDGSYAPMAFGPLGRGWTSRSRYAGTYDEAWLKDVFPFLPADFDERYFQAAPLDQQLLTPPCGAEVTLVNLTRDGHRHLVIPDFLAPVHVFPKKGNREDYDGMLDTIVFEPDLERFTMSWRVCRPLRENIFEVAQVLVGKKGREWWQQREEGRFPVEVVTVPMYPEAQEADAQ
jgi:hypothetical protein